MGRPKSTRKCVVENCGKPHYGENLCRMHFTRMKRNGSVESKYDKTGYAPLGGIRDKTPGRRGSLAVNIINDIKYKAIKRGKTWNLSHEQVFSLMSSSCTYCGFEPEWPENRVGIDRVKNDIGYQIDNCVPCCFTCNSAKGTMSYEEFKSWIKRAYNFTFKRNSI